MFTRILGNQASEKSWILEIFDPAATQIFRKHQRTQKVSQATSQARRLTYAKIIASSDTTTRHQKKSTAAARTTINLSQHLKSLTKVEHDTNLKHRIGPDWQLTHRMTSTQQCYSCLKLTLLIWCFAHTHTAMQVTRERAATRPTRHLVPLELSWISFIHLWNQIHRRQAIL